jgi:hypothetical protein
LNEESAVTPRFGFFLFVTSGTALGVLVWLAWLLGKGSALELPSIAAKMQFVGLVGAATAALVGIVGAYYSFFTPFSPQVTVGVYTWRVRPEGSPNPSVEIALWLSVQNRGVTPGEIRDLMAVLSLPKGDWLLSPMFFLDSQAYLRAISNSNDSPNLPTTEPFSPIFVAGRGQTSKSVLFMPFDGKANRQFLEPGIHKIRFFARLEDGSVIRVAERNIVFEPGVVENWRRGTTIGGAQFERDRPEEEVLRDFGITVRTK